MPAATTPLIGRELEIAQVSQWLTEDRQRLVTIVGPGGMGKMRLGLAVGAALLDQFADGVYFVNLAPLEHPDEIGPAIAAALDYQAPDKTKALFPQLLTTLSRQQLLLILDNFEHVLDGAVWVNEILQVCPDAAVLVTSRQRLNLASESRFELGGLDFPDWLTPEDAVKYTAVQLFVENGRRTQPDFALTHSNATDVVRVCQLVQGMPLGLLHMQAVFDYSWQMMSVAEQAVLAKLSVFRGGFSREAAVQVTNTNLRVLLSLVNKSLLQRNPESGRFAMHKLLRQFAASQRRRGKRGRGWGWKRPLTR